MIKSLTYCYDNRQSNMSYEDKCLSMIREASGKVIRRTEEYDLDASADLGFSTNAVWYTVEIGGK